MIVIIIELFLSDGQIHSHHQEWDKKNPYFFRKICISDVFYWGWMKEGTK